MPKPKHPGIAPWSLRVFGERGYPTLTFPDDTSTDDLDEIRRIFPEAIVTPPHSTSAAH